MTKQQLWMHFINSNPHWDSKGVSLTANGLKDFYSAIYNEAYKEGINSKPKDDFGDIFNSMFGNK